MMKVTPKQLEDLEIRKKQNYALKENLSKEEFVDEVLDGLGEPPKIFSS